MQLREAVRCTGPRLFVQARIVTAPTYFVFLRDLFRFEVNVEEFVALQPFRSATFRLERRDVIEHDSTNLLAAADTAEQPARC